MTKAGGSEERLAAVTVGELSRLNGTIELVSYDPKWPPQYAQLEAQIRRALGAKVLQIEHVGSTSVPNLAAKPIIDIVLAVQDSADESAYVPALEQAGFVLRIREPDWFEHRMFKSPTVAGNVHVFTHGCEEMTRMLAFRDWLRTSDADRALYEKTKRELAGRVWRYTQDYADAKSEVVRAILGRAIRTDRSIRTD
jgi:GrpB-like predicted nucleotidyltransferase (UPF0157 family)